MAERKNEKAQGKKVVLGTYQVARESKSGQDMVTKAMPRRSFSGVDAKTDVVSEKKSDLAVIKESLSQAEMDKLIELAGDDIQDVLDRLKDR
ncbi:hypothetical protein [Sulfitobacter aestuariivivens]|uniref:Uncharacterized protein n=1 Tax=Sulfitobacter aestuariivivens TaxID=2766981 RepID=A0A927D3L8_9RHOB|nr:hypothetical protein [Sulfitobacter aestuariivivens]MBD3664369.1 hypothetical protein [Sulfitobacter aestuariivivens]